MKNPFKPDPGTQEHDNPVVPNVVEQPVERAADRAAMHDNPLVPNVIERPVERALERDRVGAVNSRPGTADHRPSNAEHYVTSSRMATADENRQIDLFPDDELTGYRSRWESIQTGFVDQPRAAVEQADTLVSQVMNRLTEVFTRERSTLEGQWTKGDNVSTEDLRVALTRYRSFFNRLLSM